jgi:hypothetical protein
VIVFDLQCEESGDRFEAWFRSSADYEDQRERGLVQCPVCQSSRITKAPMAPRVPKKSSAPNLAQLALLQAELLKGSDWVGDRFADEARAMHLGEIGHRPVHGNATAAEAKALIEEGIPVAPLPLPITPPDQVN